MRTKISAGTVQTANERLIRSGHFIAPNIRVPGDSLRVSVKFRGQIISQSITPAKIKSCYGKSLKALSNATKL